MIQWCGEARRFAPRRNLVDTQTPAQLIAALRDPNANTHASYTAWTTYSYAHKQLVSVKTYYDIANSQYTETKYGYDAVGRKAMMQSPDGTITCYGYNGAGNVLSTWIGTDAVPATNYDSTGGIDWNDFEYWLTHNPTAATAPADTNMLRVSSSTYDADGLLLTSTAYSDDVSYTTYCEYDWRNRATDVLSPAGVVTHYVYDNLGRVTETDTYADGSYSSGIQYNTNKLRAKTTAAYDNRGRVYESRVYCVTVDQSGVGTAGDYLPSYTWYDPNGNVIKTETGGTIDVVNGVAYITGAFTKTEYDGLGRVVVQYTGYDDTVAQHAGYDDSHGESTAELYSPTTGLATLDVNDDTIVQQTQYWYDPAGETVATASYQRFPGDDSTAGLLDATDSYATAAVYWYDGLGRTVAAANFGREDKGCAERNALLLRWNHRNTDRR